MPLRLKVFYVIGTIVSFLVALIGYDAIWSTDKQIFWILTAKTLKLIPAAGVILFIGGIGLIIMMVVGYLTDAHSYKNKKL